MQDIWQMFWERKGFFLGLLLEHLEISVIAILIAIVFGGIVGILISEYQSTAKLTLESSIFSTPYLPSPCWAF